MTAVDTLVVGFHFTTHRKGFLCNSTLGSDYPLGIPLITPLSQSWSESTQLLKGSSVEPQLEPPWQHMDTELDMKVAMGWCCALLGVSPQGHLKVISRSLQGRTRKNMIFFCIYSKPISGASEYYKWLLLTHYWSGTISPQIESGLYDISALMGDYPLGIPLITPLSQRCSKSTKLLKCSSVEHQLQPSWQH